MRSRDHFSRAERAATEPFGTPKRLASFPRLQPPTKSRLSSAHVCLFNHRGTVYVYPIAMALRLGLFGGSCSPERLTSFRAKRETQVVTIIEIRPFRNGWQGYESVVMQSVFLDQEQAIDCAKGRACFGSGEIRILD